jgi:hypothetical protein
MDPMKSECISKNLQQFAAAHNINSILYVPLNEGEEVTNFMTFDAREQRKRYDEAEIEIFLFLGELLKYREWSASRYLRLQESCHCLPVCGESKNVDQESIEKFDHQKYVESFLKKPVSFEMALSIYHVGKERIVTSRESSNDLRSTRGDHRNVKQNVTLKGPFEKPSVFSATQLGAFSQPPEQRPMHPFAWGLSIRTIPRIAGAAVRLPTQVPFPRKKGSVSSRVKERDAACTSLTGSFEPSKARSM